LPRVRRVNGVGAEFAIRPMTAADAHAVATWRYPDEYSFYDADADPGDLAELLDPAGWGKRYFAADELAKRTLAGVLVVKLTGRVAEIGLGLRPGLTGRGLGESFLRLPAICLGGAGSTQLYPGGGGVQPPGDHRV